MNSYLDLIQAKDCRSLLPFLPSGEGASVSLFSTEQMSISLVLFLSEV